MYGIGIERKREKIVAIVFFYALGITIASALIAIGMVI